MVYQNHGLTIVIQWKRWMATEIHQAHSDPIRNKWSPLCQFTLGDEDTSTKSKSCCVYCLAKEVVLLSLLLHTHLGYLFPKVFPCLLVIISHYPLSYILGENIPPGEYYLQLTLEFD
jgi:hypothetical protein